MRPPSKGLLLLALVAAFAVPATAQYSTPIAQSARSGALGGSLFYIPGEQNVNIDYRWGFLQAAMADKSLYLQLTAGLRGTALATYSHRGDATWHEQQAMLGYGLQVTDWLHAAVAARWLQRGVGDAHYESHQWLAPSVLLQAVLGHTTLTLVAGSRPWDADYPWRLHVQAAYHALPHFLTLAELECEDRTRLRLGMEYVYDDSWFLRAGMATHPIVFTFGLGTRLQRFCIDLTIEVQNVLGITPQTSLSWWF